MNLTKETKDIIVFTMRTRGVVRAVGDYSGSGDSGQFDGVTFYGVGGGRVDVPETVTVPVEFTNEDPYTGSETQTREVQSLAAAVETLTLAALDASGHDWYNNDGGQGQFVIELDPEHEDGYVFRLEHQQNITSVEEYEHTY